MKMRFFFSFCLFLFSTSINAQVDYIKLYHPFIYAAENDILEGNYHAALKNYNSAFSKVTRPFARDYLNAAVVAVKTGKEKLALRYCDSLIAKGVRVNFFKGYSAFQSLWKSSGGKKFLSHFERKYQQFNKDRDTAFAELFVRMSDMDQEFRLKPDSYRKYSDTIKKIDSLNITLLRLFIERHGFPNENMINVTNPVNSQLPASIVFHHYCQSLSLSREGKYNFIQIFFDAVRKGEMDPHDLSYLLSLQNEKSVNLGGVGVMACLLNGVRGKLVGIRYEAGKLAQVDQQRLAYGLEPLSEYYKKAVFANRSENAKDFALGIYKMVNAFEMETEAECRKFMDAMQVLE